MIKNDEKMENSIMHNFHKRISTKNRFSTVGYDFLLFKIIQKNNQFQIKASWFFSTQKWMCCCFDSSYWTNGNARYIWSAWWNCGHSPKSHVHGLLFLFKHLQLKKNEYWTLFFSFPLALETIKLLYTYPRLATTLLQCH